MTIIEKFDGHFESLDSADTNSNVILERLTSATITQYTNITKFLSAIIANSANANIVSAATGTPRNTSIHTPALPPEENDNINRRITQLKTEVRGKWISGSFCFTHGHGVSYVTPAAPETTIYLATCTLTTEKTSFGPRQRQKLRLVRLDIVMGWADRLQIKN